MAADHRQSPLPSGNHTPRTAPRAKGRLVPSRGNPCAPRRVTSVSGSGSSTVVGTADKFSGAGTRTGSGRNGTVVVTEGTDSWAQMKGHASKLRSARLEKPKVRKTTLLVSIRCIVL